MRYLAIDHGIKRTGLAICDAEERIASPLCVLKGQKNLPQEIAQIVSREEVGAIVLGLPLNMDGSEGPQAHMVKAFAERLKQHAQVPVFFQDERLSSFGAREKLETTGLAKARRRSLLDAVAAAEILQSFLDHRSGA
jgi:putative Holliday junction resolvase